LISLRIPAVYVATPYTDGSEGAQGITEEFRIKTTQTVKRVFCLMESLRPEVPCQEVQGLGKKFVTVQYCE